MSECTPHSATTREVTGSVCAVQVRMAGGGVMRSAPACRSCATFQARTMASSPAEIRKFSLQSESAVAALK